MTPPQNPRHQDVETSPSERATRTMSAVTAVAEQPVTWLAAAAVFIGNAILSALRGDWVLAVLAAGTGTLAALSAAGASRRSGPSR
jgi:hypothetical protein